MNCIVVDDEPIARMGMEDLIASNQNLKLLATFKSAVGIDKYLKENKVDLIFLDIEMPGVNGLEFAATIPDRTLVIFTTAYSQYALESYEVEAIDYLVKPIDLLRFQKAVEKAENYLKLLHNFKASIESASESFITIRVDRMNHKIFFDDIVYIEALKDYVILYTQKEKYITWMNLKTIHGKLPQTQFLRISKSAVVNRNQVSSYDGTQVVTSRTELPIGKAFRDDVLNKLL